MRSDTDVQRRARVNLCENYNYNSGRRQAGQDDRTTGRQDETQVGVYARVPATDRHERDPECASRD
jgi:hypothetical protein